MVFKVPFNPSHSVILGFYDFVAFELKVLIQIFSLCPFLQIWKNSEKNSKLTLVIFKECIDIN